MTLYLYNSLTRRKEPFTPLDENNVRMYVCGPTVYDRPHIGNARAVVVYDVLYRLLRHLYPNITYARNITDVDDKINAAAKANGEPISALTERVTDWFHEDMKALGNLPPTIEPRATEEIPAIIELIERIIANKHGYVAEGHVLFDVPSIPQPNALEAIPYFYGKLSGKQQEDLISGARVQVESYKCHPNDFVLWKPANEGDDPSSVFDSPWGKGRPGWHIECSAMSSRYLGQDFDIHGGGADLKFPHHENEIAQSRCAHQGSVYARYWVHNGFVTVNGEKMSKSLGNFITVHDLLKDCTSEAERRKKGEIIRYALLSAKYNEPLDWTEQRLKEAEKTLDKWYRLVQSSFSAEQGEAGNPEASAAAGFPPLRGENDTIPPAMLEALCDDMNTPKLFSLMHSAKGEELLTIGKLLGLLQQDDWTPHNLFITGTARGKGSATGTLTVMLSDETIQQYIDLRTEAKKARNFAEADRIRAELAAQGIILEDTPQGTTWRRG